MKTNFKKGIQKGLPVYSKKYGFIAKENIHFENMSYRVGDRFYDMNGKGYNDYLYCKIPFFCNEIIGISFIFIITFLISISFYYNNTVLRMITLYITVIPMAILYVAYVLLYLEKFKNKK